MKGKIKIQDESGDKKYFTIIPNYILNHSTLWDREVYIQMKRITGENGICWTSQKTLAKQCGMSINRLKKSLKYLTEHQWIKNIGTKIIETKGGPQKINEYSVLNLWKLNGDFYETKKSKGVSPDDIPNPQRGITDEGKGVSPDDDKEEHREEELRNSEKQVFAFSNLFFSSLEGYFIQGYKQRYGIEPVLNYAKDRASNKSRITAALKKMSKWPPGPEDLAAFEAHGKKLIDFFFTTEKAGKYPSLAVVFSADTINQFKLSKQ